MLTTFTPKQFKTKHGTPYLKEPGVIPLAHTAAIHDFLPMQDFLDEFDEELEFKEYFIVPTF